MTPPEKIRNPSVPLVHKVLDVRKWVRADAEFRYKGLSRHGYVVHCTISGRCWHVSSGCGYELSRGSVVWLDDLEEHACEVRKAPWTFCSVQFLAPSLILPEVENRARRVSNTTIGDFINLHKVWNDPDLPDNVGSLRIQALVAKILADIMSTSKVEPFVIEEATRPWWDLESEVRHRLDRPMQLADLEELAGLNRNALSQLCRKATGTSPMKRLKHLRLNHAASLLMGSKMMIQDIAKAVGYSRVHEFSRDFRRAYGIPARTYRSQGRPPESELSRIKAGD